MVPPYDHSTKVVYDQVPLKLWSQYLASDTAESCEQSKIGDFYWGNDGTVGQSDLDHYNRRELARRSRCIASDDPRLREGR
jgi:hypothetical protein